MSNTTTIPKGYKKTAIGVIPIDWEVKKLGELGELKNGINKDKDQFGFGYPLINLNDVFEINTDHDKDFSLVNSNEKERRDYSLDKGDVLFVRSSVKATGVGLTCAILKDIKDAVYSGFIIRFRDNHYLDLGYKIHCFFEQGFRNRLLAKSTISANININQVALNSLQLPIPPLPEQQKIAEILSTWDEAITNCKNTINTLKARNKGLAQQLLTGKKRLSGFSDKWVELKTDKIFRNNTDKTHEGKLEILSATQERGVIPRSMNNIDIKYDASSLGTYKKVEKGDYVISLRSFQGGIEYSEYEGIVSPAYTILKEIIPISKTFFKVYFKTETFISKLNTIIYGIRDGKQISFKDFATLKLPCPSVEEQTAISLVLETADQELKSYQAKLEILQLQKKGLMQQLLTGKIRVNVN
jgi:type I restriction enzyme S subunit